MDINFELYKVFYYVAATGSFSEAAKLLFVSQSAVSQSIKTLEKKLDTSLFSRRSKKIALTPSGELLFKHIEPAMNLIRQGESRLTQPDSLSFGQLHIGASDTICRYFLVPYLKEFHHKYPDISIKVTNQTSLKCVDLLAEGKVDVILTNFPNSRLRPDFTQKTIAEFEDVFIAGPAFSHLKGKTLSLKELQEYPILMLDSQSTTSEYLHNLFREHDLELVPDIELGSNDLLIDLAKIDLGIAFVPDYCVPHTDGLFRVSVREALPKRRIVAACSGLIPASAVTREFITALPSHSKIH